MKHLFLCIITSSLIFTGKLFSQSDISDVDKLTGPRFGVTFIGEGSSSQILNRIHQMDSVSYSEYSGPTTAITTQYGWQWETRFADTGGPVIGLVEWVVLVAGMEKGMFLPSFSSLIGIRSENGFEFATGPNLSGSGLGFVFALGYNYKKGDLNLPINLAFVPNKITNNSNSPLSDILNSDDYFDDIKSDNTGFRITLSVGFNLNGKN